MSSQFIITLGGVHWKRSEKYGNQKSVIQLFYYPLISFHLILALGFCLPGLQDFISLPWALGLVFSISKQCRWDRGDTSLPLLPLSALLCSQGMWIVVMVHAMVLIVSETSLGTYIIILCLPHF